MEDQKFNWDIIVLLVFFCVAGYAVWQFDRFNNPPPPDLGPLPQSVNEIQMPPIDPCPVKDGCKG